METFKHAYISPVHTNICINMVTALYAYLYVDAPSNVSATVLTPRSVEITWNVFSTSTDIIGYLISYNTTASYTSGGDVTVNDVSTSRYILTNLEEYTSYTITVQTISNNGTSDESIEVLVTTYTASK